jgi:DNA-directed RNA polymerase specialized sigma24 family protein
MDRQLGRRPAERVVELGRAGDGKALGELAVLLGKPSAEVRRLAASAIGKLRGRRKRRPPWRRSSRFCGIPIR